MNIGSVVALISLFAFAAQGTILFFTSAVIMFALTEPDSWLNKVLNRKIFRHAGKFSYAIYLNHALIIWCINDSKEVVFNLLGMEQSKLVIGAVYFVVLSVYSVGTMLLVDYLKKKFGEDKKLPSMEHQTA
jgi:peptidoglycan/LPS O-acetylase OafA/YrhL